MGWKDAPVVSAPPSNAPAWASAPLADQAELPDEGGGILDAVKQGAGNVLAGAVRGAGSIGATIMTPLDAAARALGVENSFIGRTDRREAMDDALGDMGAETDSLGYGAGKLATEIAGTAGAGGVIAKPLQAIAPRLASAVATAGMKTGGPVANTLSAKAADMGVRMAGSGITGGASAGLVDPDIAGTGALIGAALPPALKAAGAVGGAVKRTIQGVAPDAATLKIAQEARKLGYVMPPTMVKPTLANRGMEGLAGKLSTAQIASARNQKITNELVRRAIGADELSVQGIEGVRRNANSAYSQLGNFGAMQTDDAFREALQSAAGRTKQMAADFPELANNEVDDLIQGLMTREGFDSQSAIEAIKQLRFSGSANKIGQDPTKKALGSVQMKVAAALEDLVDRNLEKSGASDLLGAYRNARTTLAKAYDVEKALNPATGNIDAQQFVRLAKKGRPLTGELKQVADFAGAFPTATKRVENMGSLPGVSPLDWASMGTMSALTGNPAVLAGVVARPAARMGALSGPVQNSLAKQPAASQTLLQDPGFQEAVQLLIRRGAPIYPAD